MYAGEIANYLESELRGPNIEVNKVASIFKPLPQSIIYLKNYNQNILEKINNLDYLVLIICSKVYGDELNVPYIIVQEPRLSFTKVLKHFFTNEVNYYIDNSAIIDSSVKIGKKALIKRNVVIESDVVIGNNCIIEENVIIRPNTVVGDECIIRANTVIGGEGFGFVKENDIPLRIPHIGGVIIKNNCEIGENSCINRGTIDDTIIENNVKISSQVKVAHNVIINKNSMLATGVQLSGSCYIGQNVWIGTNSTIMNKVSLGDRSVIGIGSVVIHDVKENTIVKGNPAK